MLRFDRLSRARALFSTTSGGKLQLSWSCTWDHQCRRFSQLAKFSSRWSQHGVSQRREEGENVWSFSLTQMKNKKRSGVSTILAATYPERVRTITLVDGFGPWIWPSDQSVAKDFRKYYDTSKLLMNKKPNVFKTKEEAMAKISNNNPSLAPHSIASLVTRFSSSIYPFQTIFFYSCPLMDRVHLYPGQPRSETNRGRFRIQAWHQT